MKLGSMVVGGMAVLMGLQGANAQQKTRASVRVDGKVNFDLPEDVKRDALTLLFKALKVDSTLLRGYVDEFNKKNMVSQQRDNVQELNRLGVNLNFVLEDDSLKEIFLEELSYKANFENPNVPSNIRAIQEQGFFVAGFESPFIYNKEREKGGF